MSRPFTGRERCPTRRKFLEDAMFAVGGAAISSTSILTACNSSANKSPSAIGTQTTGSEPPSTSTTVNPTMPAGTTSSPAVTNLPVSTSSPAISLTDFVYVPSTKGMEMRLIPGSVVFVAMDRLYTIEHMWVKRISNDIAAVGISDKLQKLMDVVINIGVSGEGETLVKDEFCGSAESWKMNVSFVAPISGKVLQLNRLLSQSLGSQAHVIHIDPYVGGWMQVVQMSKPQELDELLTAEEYIAMNAKAEEQTEPG
jgi:glycine cleavage system H protein